MGDSPEASGNQMKKTDTVLAGFVVICVIAFLASAYTTAFDTFTASVVLDSSAITITVNSDRNVTINTTPLHTFNITTNQLTSCLMRINGTAYYNNETTCYQESANASTVCGGKATGNYSNNGLWTNIANAYDGDWGTYASVGVRDLAVLYINYSIPTTHVGTRVLWEGKTGSESFNLSLPSECTTSSPIQLKVQSYVSYGGLGAYSNFSCYNGSLWNSQRESTGLSSSLLYEEAIWWSVNKTQLEHTWQPTLSNGNYTINYTCDTSNVTATTNSYWINQEYPEFNLTIVSDQNLTLYTTPQTINATTTNDAYCDLFVGSDAYLGQYGYQENGNYTSAHSSNDGFDGDFSTYFSNQTRGDGDVLQEFFVQYNKTSGSTSGSLWRIKDSIGETNLSIPATCWAQSYLDFKIVYFTKEIGVGGIPTGNYISWLCNNGSEYLLLRNSTGASATELYEEAMWFYTGTVGKNHEFNVTLGEGNISVSFDCTDSYSQLLLRTYWLYRYGNVSFISPSSGNNTNSAGNSWIYTNVTTDFGLDSCYLQWDDVNYTMQVYNSTNSFLNNSVYTNGNYSYKVWCNSSSSSEFYSSELRWFTINTTEVDTTPPIIFGCVPASGTNYANSESGKNKTIQCFSNEKANVTISTDSDGYNISNVFNVQNAVPLYTFRTNVTLCTAGESACSLIEYISAQDIKGNTVNNTVSITLSVAGSGGTVVGGGGGGGGEITVYTDNFALFSTASTSTLTCVGAECINSVTYDSTTARESPIGFRSCADTIKSPNSGGIYTVCNLINRTTTLEISVVGYETAWGGTSQFLNVSNTSLTIPANECRNFNVIPHYPEEAEEEYYQSESMNRSFYILISGYEKEIKIPVERMTKSCDLVEQVLEAAKGELLGIPVVVVVVIVIIVVIIFIIIVSGGKSKRKPKSKSNSK